MIWLVFVALTPLMEYDTPVNVLCFSISFLIHMQVHGLGAAGYPTMHFTSWAPTNQELLCSLAYFKSVYLHTCVASAQSPSHYSRLPLFAETFLTDVNHVPNPQLGLVGAVQHQRTLHMPRSKVLFVLLPPPPTWSPDGLGSQTGNCAVTPLPREACRPQLLSVSMGNFHPWKTGCFRP